MCLILIFVTISSTATVMLSFIALLYLILATVAYLLQPDSHSFIASNALATALSLVPWLIASLIICVISCLAYATIISWRTKDDV